MIVEQIWTANSGRNFNYLIAAKAAPEERRGMAEHGGVVVGGPGEAQGRELDFLRLGCATELAAALTDPLRELHGPPWRL